MKIVLDIKTCMDCPFIDVKRHYTADSFEHENDWFCKKQGGKSIATAVSWYEEKDTPVPDWCPVSADKIAK